MTKEEYNEEMKKIDNVMNNMRNQVRKHYAFANNPYKVGQIIEDHYQRILIEKIEMNYCILALPYPECKYWGLKLTKQNRSFKNSEKNWIFQSDIKRIIEEEGSKNYV